MLVKHDLYVADKTRQDYAHALRRSYQEPSLLEHVISGLLSSLRQALSRVDFPEQDQPTTFVKPASDRLQRSDRVRG